MDNSQASYQPLGGIQPYMWIVYSFMALLCFSFGGVISGQASDFPFHLALTASLASLTFLVTICTFFALRFLCREKRFPTIYDSNLFKNGKLSPGVKFGCLGGFLTMGGMLSYILGWYFDENGRGIIVSIFSSSTIFTSLLSHFIFKEKLTVCQGIGMAIGCGGIIVISIESGSDGTWISYLCGISSFLCFGLANLINRKMQIEGLDPLTGGTLYAFGHFATGALMLVILVLSGLELDQSDFEFGIAYCGYLIIFTAIFCSTRALMTGHIPISLSISNSQGAVFILLEYLLFDIRPSIIKLAGAMIVIVGLLILFTGDSILNKIKGKDE